LAQRSIGEDASGKVVATAPLEHVTKEKMEEIMPQFLGEILQVPPMFSALRVNGKRLYELAHQGVTVEREARKVLVHKLELLAFEPPTFSIRVECGGGLYVRTLGKDLARAAGTMGHVVSLRRTHVGDFLEEDCLSLEEAKDAANIADRLDVTTYGASAATLASRCKAFSRTKIDHSRCLARTWASAKGGQCTRTPCKPSKCFCKCHGDGHWKVHGRVEGLIPMPKLIEFERYKAGAGKLSPCSTLVPVAGGPRKVVQLGKSQEKLLKAVDGSTTHTKTKHDEKSVSCRWTGAKVEKKSVTRHNKVERTKSGRLVETEVIIMKRVRYK
ncbi:unnamed protein product, partial [Polarella glacialis]